MVGNVKAPGAFPIADADGLSVMKAVGLCQGLLPYSRPEAIVYRLAPGTNQRVEITVPLRDILKHRSPDVPLRPDDIFYVADHTGKRIAGSAIERITGLSGAATTVVMWRQIQ